MQGTAVLTVGCAIIIGCAGGSIPPFKAAAMANGISQCPARSTHHNDKHCVCDLGYECTHTDAQLATVHCRHGYRQRSDDSTFDSLPRSGFRRPKCPLCLCSFTEQPFIDVNNSKSSSPTRRGLLEVDAPSSSSPEEPTQPRHLHPANQALLNVLKTVTYDHPVREPALTVCIDCACELTAAPLFHISSSTEAPPFACAPPCVLHHT